MAPLFSIAQDNTLPRPWRAEAIKSLSSFGEGVAIAPFVDLLKTADDLSTKGAVAAALRQLRWQPATRAEECLWWLVLKCHHKKHGPKDCFWEAKERLDAIRLEFDTEAGAILGVWSHDPCMEVRVAANYELGKKSNGPKQ